jgi:hypothetical protein
MTWSPQNLFERNHALFSGVIRRVNNTTWGILNTSDGHEDWNVLAVSVSGNILNVTWDFGTPAYVIWGVANADEEYAKFGIQFGTAMNTSNLGIYAYMNTSGGKIISDGTVFSTEQPPFDIADSSAGNTNGKYGNIYSTTWNGTAGTVGGIPAYTCRVLFEAYNTDMPFYPWIDNMSATRLAIKKDFGTAGGARAYVDVQFYDWAGSLQTTIDSAMAFTVFSTRPCPVNISKLDMANSNIWISGIVKLAA